MPQYPKVKMYQLAEKEKLMIMVGLNMRRAFIETGDPLTTAADAVRSGQQNIVKTLSTDQMRLIIATEELINKLCDWIPQKQLPRDYSEDDITS